MNKLFGYEGKTFWKTLQKTQKKKTLQDSQTQDKQFLLV
jgi:hypothetical protein